jgi:signal transduction histidine kinase
VRIAVNGALELEVTDDGEGIPSDAVPGVGLGSMRERAAELGGSCDIETAAGGGTVVHARLPLERA